MQRVLWQLPEPHGHGLLCFQYRKDLGQALQYSHMKDVTLAKTKHLICGCRCHHDKSVCKQRQTWDHLGCRCYLPQQIIPKKLITEECDMRWVTVLNVSESVNEFRTIKDCPSNSALISALVCMSVILTALVAVGVIPSVIKRYWAFFPSITEFTEAA